MIATPLYRDQISLGVKWGKGGREAEGGGLLNRKWPLRGVPSCIPEPGFMRIFHLLKPLDTASFHLVLFRPVPIQVPKSAP